MEKLKDIIAMKSNDYTCVADEFSRQTGRSLMSDNHFEDVNLLSVPVSIVLPSYRVYEQLPHTLNCLRDQVYKNFEVIVVDDNSNPPLESVVRGVEVDFPIKYVRIPFNKNRNPNHARNVGLSVSDSSNIILLDSDMIVPRHFTANLGAKMQYTNGCLFTGFRENIGKREDSQGPADISKDWRHTVVIGESFHNFMPVNINGNRDIETPKGVLHILDETNNFKDFGYGRSVAYWDLPAMVIGHCIAFNRDKAIRSGGFPELFIKWGIDDIAFGANMVANDQHIIPSLNTVNHHVVHRSKEYFQKSLDQLRLNLEKYLHYARSEYESAFPSFRVKIKGKEASKIFLEEEI